jgi:two-component system NtrC family sensor kinase
LEFIDNGKGIRKDYINRIFDPFFTTNRSVGSKGLGLNIAYNIITYNMSGTIVCESHQVNGTKFTINIPNACPGNESKA